MNTTIIQAFQNLANTNPQWLSAIEQRPTGSQWIGERIPWQVLSVLPWEIVLPNRRYKGIFQPNCFYFHLSPLVAVDIGYENIRLLSDFKGDYSSIELHEGSHGKELVSKEIKHLIPTCEAWLIVGPDSNFEQHIVYTAYPGRIAASINKADNWDGTISQSSLDMVCLNGLPIAVKGIA